MTRKSGKHLHAKYGILNSCFDLLGSHQQCTPYGFSSHENSSITLISPFKYHIILFPAYEVNAMWIYNTDLGSGSPGGDRALFWEYAPSSHIRSSGRVLSPWLVNSASLICDMNWWPSGRVSASAYCGCWSDLQWWRSRCVLLMRPKKVETAVQCSAWRCEADNFNIYGKTK